MKVNKPGIRLREKSSVHKNIIDENTGRRKTKVYDHIEDIMFNRHFSSNYREYWPFNGDYLSKFRQDVLLTDAKLIKKLFSKKPIDVFFLGPGKGEEILFFNKLIFNKQIDTLGLTNNLYPEIEQIVRKDYSPEKLSEKKTFEHFNHLKLVRKYNYIYSYMGPATHSYHKPIVLLKIASMLKPNGFARIYAPGIELKSVSEYIALNKLEKKVSIKLDLETNSIIIKRLI